MATQESRNTIQNMYVGYYGRPADEAGLAFWADLLEANLGDLSAIVDAFGTSDEYIALSAGKSSTELVNIIFNSLFNRDAEGTADDIATGLGFYVDQLDSGAMTAATIAKSVIDGATNTDAQDLTSIANKLEVANHFTAAVLTGNKTYGPNEIDEGQAVINGVTADPATIDPGKADADSKVGAFPGETFTVPSGIIKLDAAEGAKAAFLVTADGDEDPNTSTDKATLDGNLATAVAAVDVVVAGDYAGGSAAVRAALLADQEGTNATALTDAQADVDAVPGLADAVTSLKAAEDAQAAAVADELTKQAALDGAKANYDTLNAATVTVAGDGTASDGGGNLIVLTDGSLVLEDLVTETTNPGVGALLAASIAFEAAQKVNSDSVTSVADAKLAVNLLDTPPAATDELLLVGQGMGIVDPAVEATPTLAEIESERTALTDGIAALNTAIGELTFDTDEATTEGNHAALTAAAVTAGFISGTNKTDIDAEFDGASTIADGGATLASAIAASQAELATDNGLVTFNALITDFTAAVDAEAVSNPLLEALDTANADIEDLAALVATETAERALVDELTTLQDAVDAAEQAFTDEGLEVPVTLAAGANAATANSDIFKFGGETSTITNFNAAGTDTLSIGSGFTLNEGDVATAGDNAVLEVFLTEVSGDTVVTLEKTVFGSNASTPEVDTITLTGVVDVALAEGGLITVPVVG